MGFVVSVARPVVSLLRPGISFTQEFNLLVTGDHYIVPMQISLEDINEPVLKAENATATIFQNIEQFVKEDNVIAEMVYDHVVQFKNRFHELHYTMHDFSLHIIRVDD